MTKAELGKWLFDIIIERQKQNQTILLRARIEEAAELARWDTWQKYAEKDQNDGVGCWSTGNPFDVKLNNRMKELKAYETLAANYDELLKYVVEHFIEKSGEQNV